MATITGYPFVSHVDQQARPIITDVDEEIKRIFNRHHSLGEQVLRQGRYKLMGYYYDFKPHLNLFLYRQYDSWQEAYAPNRTTLRKMVYGKIDRIIKLE